MGVGGWGLATSGLVGRLTPVARAFYPPPPPLPAYPLLQNVPRPSILRSCAVSVNGNRSKAKNI
jgi:hypothetical protein